LLSKQYRANPAEIILAREEGKLISGPLFSLLIFDLGDRVPSRFAFIVSTKINKRATKRNRVKRLLRQVINLLVPKIKEGRIVLFLAKKKLLGKNLEMIGKEVERMLRKSEVIENVK